MGIGKSRTCAAALVGSIAVSLLSTSAVQGFERTTGIWKVLRAGHFSGAMDEDARITPMAVGAG